MRFAALLASLAVAASALPAEAQSQTPPSPAADVATFDFRVVVAEVRRVIGERCAARAPRGA